MPNVYGQGSGAAALTTTQVLLGSDVAIPTSPRTAIVSSTPIAGTYRVVWWVTGLGNGTNLTAWAGVRKAGTTVSGQQVNTPASAVTFGLAGSAIISVNGAQVIDVVGLADNGWTAKASAPLAGDAGASGMTLVREGP